MSKTIDEKVVEMRFDNKNFESNVQTTLSTLDKLKQKLNLKGASQGLENIQTAANKVDMSGMSGAIDTVQARFSALQVMGVTALANITNAAVNAGKNIVSALTVAPVMDGFREYETQINSVQTIMANTGDDVKTVNAALDKLNEYADLTIYNFSEMTSNAGTFTAALGKGSLDKTMVSLKGIGNWAAYAGANASDMSRATFQLGQALASGSVRLQDWMSIEHTSGMAGQNFQNAFKETAKSIGVDVDSLIEKNGSFRESLKEGWLDTDVFMKTMEKFANDQDMTDAATKVKTFSQLIGTVKESLGTGWGTTWRLLIGDFEQARELWTELNNFITGFIDKASDARNQLLESALGKGFSELSDKLNKIVEPAKKVTDTVKEVSNSITDLGEVADDVILGKFGNGQERFDALTEAGQNYYEVQNKVNESLGDAFRYTDEQIQAQNELLGAQQTTTESTSEAKSETKKLTDAQKEQIKELVKLSDEQLRSKEYTDEQIAAFQELRDTADKLGIPMDTFIDKIDEINGRWLLIDSFRNIGTAIYKVFNSIGTAFRNMFDPIKPEQIFNVIGGFHKFTSMLVASDETADKLRRTFEGLFAVLNIVTTIANGAASLAFRVLSKALGLVDVDILGFTASIGDLLVEFRNWLFDNSLLAKSVDLLAEGIKVGIRLVKEWFEAFSKTPQVQEFVERVATAFNSLRDAFSTAIDDLRSGEKPVLGVLSNLGDAIGKTFTGLFDGISFDSISEAFANLWKNIGDYLSNADGLFSSAKSKIVKWLNEILDRFGITDEAVRNFVNDMSWENFLGILTEIGDYIRNFKMEDLFNETGGNIIDGLVNGLQAGAGKVVETIMSIGQKLIEAFCALLGIHSPSTEFFCFGENIIQGLINGVNSMLGALWELFSGVADNIKGLFEDIDWGVIATIAVGVGAFYTINKFADAANKFGDAAKNLTSPIKAVSDAINTFVGSFKELAKAKTMQMKAEAIKTIAISIAILAASIAVLAQLDMAKAWSAVGMIAVLAVILGGLSIAMNKFGEEITLFDSAKVSSMLLGVGIALLAFAATAKILSGVEWGDVGKAAAAVGTFGLLIALLMKVSKHAGSAEQIEKVGVIILKVSVALLLMSASIKIMGSMSDDEIWNAIKCMGAFGILVGAMVWVSKYGENAVKLSQMAKVIGEVGITLLALAVAARLIGGMDDTAMKKAAIGILYLGGIITGLIAATNLVGKNDISKIGTTLIAIGGAMALLAVTAKLIGGMDDTAMKKAAIGILYLGGIITGLIAATGLAGEKELTRVAITLLAMSASIAILAGVSVILGLVKKDNLKKGIIAVGMLSIIVDLMVLATKNAKDVKGTMIGIAVAIGVMAGAIAVLSFIDPTKLIGAVLALSMVMGMFALIELASSKVTSSFKTIASLAVAIGLIAGALTLLSMLPAEKSLVNAASVSMILLALAGAMKILDGVGELAKSAMIGLAILTGIVAVLAIILGAMSALNVEASMNNVLALSVMLLSMSGVCAILGTIVYVSKSAMKAMAVLTAIVAALAIIIGILSALDVNVSLETASSLSLLLLAMSVAVGILGAIAPLATAAVEGAIALVAVAGILTAAVMAFGAISQIPGADWLVTEGGEFLQKIGTAIGQFIGGIAGGFLEGATSTLPQVADSLSDFMVRLTPFIMGVKMIDESTLQAVDSLSTMILKLTTADLINSLTSFISGGSSLTDFADQLVPFGQAIAAYSQTIAGVDAEAIQASAQAGQSLGDLANSLPKEGGLAQSIFGENQDMSSFGAQLVSFGSAIAAYSQSVTGINAEAITSSAQAGKALSDLAGSLPKEGGLSQAIFGESTDLATFGTQLSTFGSALSSYSQSVSGLEIEPITKSVEAGKALTDLSNSLPKEDGWVQKIFGGQDDLSGFGEKLASFGGALGEYSDSIGELNIEKMSSSVKAAEKVKNLAESLTGFDSSGIDNFKVSDLGDELKAYSDSITNVSAENVSTSISAMHQLISLINSMVNIDTSGITTFKTSITELSSIDLSSIDNQFSGAIPRFSAIGSSLVDALLNGIESRTGSAAFVMSDLLTTLLNGAQSAQERCAAIGSNIVAALASGMTYGMSSVTTILSSLLSMMLNFIQGHDGLFQSAGMLLMMNFKMGLASGMDGVSAAIQSALESCLGAIGSYQASFAGAGKDLGQGLINGIASKEQAAYDAGYALGQKAVQGEKDGQKSQSPSKLTIKAGKWLGEGLVIGMDRMGKAVYNSGKSMGEQAFNSISSALSGVDTLMTNIDSVQPAIRPVVDMSNMNYQLGQLELGANIDALVSRPVNSLAGIISSAQSKINASNKEVVNAINGLRDDLNMMYESDDGTEVALYVDAKKLASSIANPMNRQLNILSRRGEGL